MKQIKKNKKEQEQRNDLRLKAFTLAEMMVVMLILSIVLAASMPIITKRVAARSTSLWKTVSSDIAHIYSVPNAGGSPGVIIGSNAKSSLDGMLYINSSNSSTYPHMVFGIGGNYVGKLNFPSTYSMELGNGATASGDNSTALGYGARALDNSAI